MEYTALYRRFRPKRFDEILGQEHITTTLKNQVINNRVGHAYLFTGSRGCGKTSSAKVLARAVNCLHPKDGEPCNECEICKSALDGSLTDIVELDAASNNGVDNIRSIIEQVNFLPVTAKYRIYIIDEVHMLSIGAFNALLKTLEEPPSHVKFILCTTDPQKIPATIISRCLRFDFKKIPDKYIVQNLANVCDECKIKYTEDSLKLIAELANGGMRDALSILDRCAQDGENSIDSEKIKKLAGIPEMQYVIDMTNSIINYDADGVIKVSETVLSEGTTSNNFLWQVIKFIKDILVYKSTGDYSNIYSESDKKAISDICERTDKQRLLDLIYSISKLENDLKWSSQQDIVFEAGMINLCSHETSIEKVVQTKVQVSEPKARSKTEEITKVVKATPENETANQAFKEKMPEKKINITKDTKFKNELDITNIIDNLPNNGDYVMLKNGLKNSKIIKIDDLNVGIVPTPQSEFFISQSLQNQEISHTLQEIISKICGEVMRIKMVKPNDLKKMKTETKEEKNDFPDLGIPFNEIDG